MTYDIGIVGAGISGLTAAITLASSGHRVVVFERFNRPQPVGSGLLIQPTGLAALASLGLGDAIESAGHRIEFLRGLCRNSLVFDLAYAELADDLHAIGIHRATLHQALWAKAQMLDIKLRLGSDIVKISLTRENRITLETTGNQKNDDFDIVVDASGARSPLVASTPERPYPYGAVWTTIDDTGISNGGLTQRYERASTMMGYLPSGRTSSRKRECATLFWSLPVVQYQHWCANFDKWQINAQRLWPELEDTIRDLPGPEVFDLAPYRQRTLRRPYQGRLVHIGDAAHCTSPQLGQGANQGMVDAVSLASALAKYSDIDIAIRQYASHRRAHVRFYQYASYWLTPLFQSDSHTLPWLRDQLFYPMSKVPTIRREMLRTLCGLKTGIVSSATVDTIVGS